MGYSKGRTASANLRKSILPTKDTKAGSTTELPDYTLAPAVYIQRYGIPPVGTEMYLRCKSSGCFDEDDEDVLGDRFGRGASEDLFRQEAEQDFQLTW